MKDHPVSTFIDAAGSTLGGVVAFYLGLIGGSAIVFSQGVGDTQYWPLIALAWVVLIPFTLLRFWGFVLVPVLVIIFYGCIWEEWNRAICGSLVAIALSAATLLSAGRNPFTVWNMPLSFFLTMGTAILVLAAGVAWELRKRASGKR